jgi:tripartite-type tricarboxylate transporter receptor subunit TctC
MTKFASVLLAAVLASTAAIAQDYPSRVVKFIVPFGPGGPADVAGRLIGKDLQESLKQSFIIENRTGAGAVIGTAEAAKAAPDGYTLLIISNTQTTNESLVPTRGYELMRDFVAISRRLRRSTIPISSSWFIPPCRRRRCRSSSRSPNRSPGN